MHNDFPRKIALISATHCQQDLIGIANKTLEHSSDFAGFEIVGIPLIPHSIEHENMSVLLNNLCLATMGAVHQSGDLTLAVTLVNDHLGKLSKKKRKRRIFTVGTLVTSDDFGPVQICTEENWMPHRELDLFDATSRSTKRSFREGCPDSTQQNRALSELLCNALMTNVRIKVDTCNGSVN